MPGMHGHDVCQILKEDENLKFIPVVFVSALWSIDAEVRGLQLGAVDYLPKPVNIEIARNRIHNLILMERNRKDLEAQRDCLEGSVQERTEALSIARETAEAAIRTKTIFLSNMSHELLTPLKGIMGMIGLLQRRLEEPKIKSYLSKAEDASQTLLSLINDLLSYSRIEANRINLKCVGFSVGDVLRGVINLQVPKANKKNVFLTYMLPDELDSLVLHGDPVCLRHILSNLVSNAVKFTDEGSIEVSVNVLSHIDGNILLRFTVMDSGVGIDAKSQKRIFHAFEQVDTSLTRRHGGVGLGLAICKQLVRVLDGEIDVQSELGVGSVFSFTARFAASSEVGVK